MNESKQHLVSDIFLHCVEGCSEAIMLTDIRGHLSYVNPAWVATYGYSKEEAIGQTPRLLRSQAQDDEFYKSMWRTILDPKIGFWRGEVSNRTKNGRIVPILLTITPSRDLTGAISGYMGIAVDLTEQKTMEQQIIHQDRLASIGMLAGGLAHEIGNPLGVIRGRAELALNQVKGNTAAESNLSIVLSQIDRISGLIHSLLRVSRVPDQILLRSVNLKSAVDEVIILTAQACRAAGINVNCNDILKFADANILAESGHLQQLLLNVIINAIHAIEEQKLKAGNSVEMHFIELSTRPGKNGKWILTVRDTGCGIAPENVKKLFQPFYTTKAAGKGTGLGLAIVAKLVDEMGATVTVHSNGVGLGAQFNFEFQSKQAAPAQLHS